MISNQILSTIIICGGIFLGCCAYHPLVLDKIENILRLNRKVEK